MRHFFIILIKLYQQAFFSQRVLGECKYYPNCSDYAIGALKRHGTIKGLAKGVWRLIRCNPLAKGGLDMP